MSQPRSIDRLVRKNLETIAELEAELYHRFTPFERLLHRLTLAIGRFYMLVVHLIIVATWLIVNSPWVTSEPLDPWPHDGLILFLSSEAIMLTILVLTAQRIMQKLDNHRAHLALQIQLLSEQEITKALEILVRIDQRLGSDAKDETTKAMTQNTNPEQVSGAIQDALTHRKDKPSDESKR